MVPTPTTSSTPSSPSSSPTPPSSVAFDGRPIALEFIDPVHDVLLQSQALVDAAHVWRDEHTQHLYLSIGGLFFQAVDADLSTVGTLVERVGTTTVGVAGHTARLRLVQVTVTPLPAAPDS
mmetsp:Transcript_3976/g.12935  ORF Transcript_3976/g.12935 Transcript_3976/m.12935 type:complete len:121 (+) Transcript_3976:357-719(+)